MAEDWARVVAVQQEQVEGDAAELLKVQEAVVVVGEASILPPIQAPHQRKKLLLPAVLEEAWGR